MLLPRLCVPTVASGLLCAHDRNTIKHRFGVRKPLHFNQLKIGRHSYDEGESFEHEEFDLDSIGGDPFFLDDFNPEEIDLSSSIASNRVHDNQTTTTEMKQQQAEILEMGGDISFLQGEASQYSRSDESAGSEVGNTQSVPVSRSMEERNTGSCDNDDERMNRSSILSEIDALGGDSAFFDGEVDMLLPTSPQDEDSKDEQLFPTPPGSLQKVALESDGGVLDRLVTDNIPNEHDAAKNPAQPMPSSSLVEIERRPFAEQLDELEAIGGDPFFLHEGSDW